MGIRLLEQITLTGKRAATLAVSGLALLPGSFNPLHEGHLGLAHVAASLLGKPVAFELSIANVDKPSLADAEVERRLAQFVGVAEIWLTRAPRFVEKARCFPGATFVVGADTAARVTAARYYDGDADRRDHALRSLCDAGCSFLVAARADATGGCWRLEDIEIPWEFAELFLGIPESRFRLDISSSELRRNFGR
ncbi:MAG: hypothetical protein U0744_16595 [Gemmataceae bacterium]